MVSHPGVVGLDVWFGGTGEGLLDFGVGVEGIVFGKLA